VVALHVNHGLPTKVEQAAEMYAPYDKILTETKPYPYELMDLTYTDVVKKKKPYAKYVKPDVIDLTGVNVNGMKEVIFPKVQDFTVNVDVDELTKEFNMEQQICDLDASVKALDKRLDTIDTTLFHGGGSNTDQKNAINSMSGVVTVISKVVTETHTKAEDTHQHVLAAIATLNAARRENTKALNKLVSGSPDTVFSDRACEEIKSCCEFALVAQAHKINDSQKEGKAKLAQDKVLKRNKKAREQYAANKEEKVPNDKRNRHLVYNPASGESAPSPPSLTEIDIDKQPYSREL
jgi:hypothetical protein